MSRDSTFDKRTLRQRCTTHVRDMIISGQMSPGEHLIETKLAEDLGVSRGTLREALRPLENEGLLIDDGRGHMLVRVITAEEIREVFQVRAALETLAARLLAQQPERSTIVRKLKSALDPLKDDHLEFSIQIAADLGFHQLICELTGNRTLLRSWQQLVGQIEMMIIAAGPTIASTRMRYAEHVVIVDAIENGDVEAASDVVEKHMDAFASMYLGDKSEVLATSV